MVEPVTTEVRKKYARILMTEAIYQGVLVRPSHCSQCGIEGRIDGHHPDYSKPLYVEWLCRGCHSRRHGRSLIPGTRMRLVRIGHKGDRQLIQRFMTKQTAELWLATAKYCDERGVSLSSVLADALARYLADPPK